MADSGTLECAGGGCRARVDDVLRLGSDQVLALGPEHGTFEPGERVRAHVDRAARHATACNHTATHLLHAALRRRLGDHVRQAGSYVGPDKLRFDFTHGSALSPEELAVVEDDVNALDPRQPSGAGAHDHARGGASAWARWRCSTRSTATSCAWSRSATALSRVSCAAAPTSATTSEIGLFRILSETSSAANVRRIEAITGPEAVGLVRDLDRELERVAAALRVPPRQAADSVTQLAGPRP